MSGLLPIDLVLVRHGESEGNLAQRRSKNGDESDWGAAFKDRHTSKYRLTDFGRQQAVIAGKWIKENIGEKFDRFYCSEYTRAMETAALLDLPGAQWITEFYLRERDKGVLTSTSKTERTKLFADELKRRELDSFYWAPAGGESIANSCLRVDRVLTSLRESCAGFKVVLVCHGNIMCAFRIRTERISQMDFHEALGRPKNTIYNCQIIHYSRRHPVTGYIHHSINWMRSVCPWSQELSSNEWVEIRRKTWTNDQLLSSVKTIPQLVNNRNIELEQKDLVQTQSTEDTDEEEAPEFM